MLCVLTTFLVSFKLQEETVEVDLFDILDMKKGGVAGSAKKEIEDIVVAAIRGNGNLIMILPASLVEGTDAALWAFVLRCAKNDYLQFFDKERRCGFKSASIGEGESPNRTFHALKYYYLKHVLPPTKATRRKIHAIMTGQEDARTFTTKAAATLISHSLGRAQILADAAAEGKDVALRKGFPVSRTDRLNDDSRNALISTTTPGPYPVATKKKGGDSQQYT